MVIYRILNYQDLYNMDGEIVEVIDSRAKSSPIRQVLKVRTIIKTLLPYPNPRKGYFLKIDNDIKREPDKFKILKKEKK